MLHGTRIASDESAFDVAPASRMTAGDAGPDGLITVPDAHLLFNGDFQRSGPDLKIVGQDGQSFLVPNYFKGEKNPTLLSPEGAALTGDIVEALAGPRAPGQYAQATAQTADQPAIGRIDQVAGNATIVRNGVAITANQGDVVRKGDVVQTGSDGQIAVLFADGSTFSLSASARMVLNDFVYQSGGANNSALISLVQGTIGFVAGQVAKTGDMRVETPVATMGIRGTAVLVEISANNGQTKFSVLVEPNGTTGSFNLYDKTSGALLGTVNNSTIGWVVSPAGPLQVIAQQVQKSPGEVQQELNYFQSIFNLFNNGQSNPFVPEQRTDNPNPQNTNGTGTQFTVNQPNNPTNPNNSNSSDPIIVTVTPVNTGNGGETPGPNNNINNDPIPTTTLEVPLLNPIAGSGQIFGTAGADYITGSSGIDEIDAGAGNDLVFAFGGDDTIIAGHGGGNDHYDGGADIDTIKFESTNDGVLVNLSGQNVSIGGITIGANSATDRGDNGANAIGTDFVLNFENVTGGSGDDILIGTGGVNVIIGGAGDGDDILDGQGGADTFEGGDGNDIFIVRDDAEWVVDGGAGVDTIRLVGDFDIRDEIGVEGPHATNVEIIDLRHGTSTVDFDADGIMDIAGHEIDGPAYIRILGDSGDQINLSDYHPEYPNGYWTKLAEFTTPNFGDTLTTGTNFDAWAYYAGDDSTEPLFTAYVQSEVAVDRTPDVDATGQTSALIEDDSEFNTSSVTITASDPDQDDISFDMSGWTRNASTYDFVASADISWTAARAGALALGGYLANITSAVENNYVRQNVGSDAWIGASDFDAEGQWVWADGPEANAQFWQGLGPQQGGSAVNGAYNAWWQNPENGGHEPTNGGSGEDYAYLDHNGVWTDLPAQSDSVNGYIVEFTTFTKIGTYGSVTFNPINDQLTYTLNNNDLDTQALALGQTEYDSFDITYVDEHGAFTTRTVNFTIQGTNDAPVIAGQTTAPIVIEDGVANTATLDLTISDPDANDTLSYAVAPSSASQHGDHSYLYVSGSFTWEEARQKALAMGGYLANITSAGENGFIQSIIAGNAFIGATDNDVDSEEGVWVWADGPEGGQLLSAAYTNWNHGGQSPVPTEPNGDGDFGETYTSPYGWNDVPAGTTHGFVVEFSGFVARGIYGTVVLNPATGELTYTLDNDDPDTQALAAGQTVIDSFEITVTDNHGLSTTETFDFTVVGMDETLGNRESAGVVGMLVQTDAGYDVNDLYDQLLNSNILNISASHIILEHTDQFEPLFFRITTDNLIWSPKNWVPGTQGDVRLEGGTLTGIEIFSDENLQEPVATFTGFNIDAETLQDAIDVYDNVGQQTYYGDTSALDAIFDSYTYVAIGGEGPDDLTGGDQSDVIFGSGGADTIDGGEGNDLLVGGLGGDTFVFQTASGQDVIVDFSQSDGDQIDLQAYTDVTDFGQLEYTISGNDTVFDLDDGNTITVQDSVYLDQELVAQTKLTANDFILYPGLN